MRRALAAFMAVFAVATAAHAGAKPATITGAWTFITDKYGPGCRLTGAANIQETKNGALVCTLVAQETCPDLKISANQTCTAKRTGEKLVISSTIKKVAPNYPYAPDNFELTIESGARMKGMLRSAHSAPAEFFRGDAPVS